jgi:hypothetical protein
MKSSIEAAMVRDLEDRATQARQRRDAYTRGCANYAEFDGKYWAFRDLARCIRDGEWEPLKQKATP